jgi:lipopolysaccharide/colanic/teichoic acid biosynthesis glycosyltransferase
VLVTQLDATGGQRVAVRSALRAASPATDSEARVKRRGIQRAARRWDRLHCALLIAADTIALTSAAAVGLVLTPRHAALGLNLLVILVWIIGLAAAGAYDLRHVGYGSTELRKIMSASISVALAVVAVAFLVRSETAREVVFVTLPVGTALLLAGRTAARTVSTAARRRGHGQHRVLAVGTAVDVLDLVEQAARSPSAGFKVVGACLPAYGGPDRRRAEHRRGSSSGPTHTQRAGDRRAGAERRASPHEVSAVGVPVVGVPEEVLSAVHDCLVDTVVIAGQGVLSRHAFRRMAWQLEGTGVAIYFASSLSDVATPRITFRPLGALSLMHVEAPAFEGGRRLLKSTADHVLALAIATVLSPLLAIIWIMIKIDSPGPAFYRQERVGLDGRPFRCFKFRTMHVGADRELMSLASEFDEVLFKMRADPRVTRVGRVLRRWSLDELPQLINVLGGSMSLVGPRPPLKSEAEGYGHDVQRRLLVKPGMTGLWQVSGRSDLAWAESVRLDLYYVENWSIALDLQIMARTIAAVAAGRGAY